VRAATGSRVQDPEHPGKKHHVVKQRIITVFSVEWVRNLYHCTSPQALRLRGE
jgi:hypothetical protein